MTTLNYVPFTKAAQLPELRLPKGAGVRMVEKLYETGLDDRQVTKIINHEAFKSVDIDEKYGSVNQHENY